jgi:hypothetical protein
VLSGIGWISVRAPRRSSNSSRTFPMRSLAIFRWVDLATGWTPGRPFQISTRRLPSGATKSANTAVAKTLPVSQANLRERWTVIWFSTSIVKHFFNVIFLRGGCPDIPFITPERPEGKARLVQIVAANFPKPGSQRGDSPGVRGGCC